MKILLTLKDLQSIHSNPRTELKDAEIHLLKNVNPKIYALIQACPVDEDELRKLAIRLIDLVNKENFDAVILPIQPPAFLFMLGRLWEYHDLLDSGHIKAIFAQPAEPILLTLSALKRLRFFSLRSDLLRQDFSSQSRGHFSRSVACI